MTTSPLLSLVLLAAAASAAGCAAFDTRVISSVPSAVTIQTFSGQARAESIAQVECAKYRKKAQFRSGFRPDYSFACID